MTEALRPLYDADISWSEEHKEAFALYRDLGVERSLRAVGQKLGKSTGLMEKWSAVGSWRIRVAAWDAEQDRIKQEAAKKELERVTKKHARAIEDTITVLMQPAIALAARIEQGDESLTQDLDPVTLANLTAQAAKVLPTLVQASRLVHGVSTQNVAVKGEHRVKVEGASPAELDAALLGIDDGSEEVIDSTAEEVGNTDVSITSIQPEGE